MLRSVSPVSLPCSIEADLGSSLQVLVSHRALHQHPQMHGPFPARDTGPARQSASVWASQLDEFGNFEQWQLVLGTVPDEARRDGPRFEAASPVDSEPKEI